MHLIVAAQPDMWKCHQMHVGVTAQPDTWKCDRMQVEVASQPEKWKCHHMRGMWKWCPPTHVGLTIARWMRRCRFGVYAPVLMTIARIVCRMRKSPVGVRAQVLMTGVRYMCQHRFTVYAQLLMTAAFCLRKHCFGARALALSARLWRRRTHARTFDAWAIQCRQNGIIEKTKTTNHSRVRLERRGGAFCHRERRRAERTV